MSIGIDTTIGNKVISEKLKCMLADLRNNMRAISDSVKEIEEQAHSEGFEDFEINLLLRTFLKEFLSPKQIDNLFYRDKKKKVLEDLTSKSDIDDNKVIEDNSIPDDISAPDYKVVVPYRLLNEVITEGQQEQQQIIETDTPRFDTYKQDYAIEDLKSQLDASKENVELLTLRNKELEENNIQLEAKTRNSPSNNIPALQGNNLITKVVVSQLFREILQLKGSKMIYANIIIDITQNKYIRIEPFH
ncbi:MAG TPA: hypothetical protein VKA87_03620 [Nitrososphaeraceae archaeon]|nr:hypothetical protein [Nitrososphaeraceae archaeon]